MDKICRHPLRFQIEVPDPSPPPQHVAIRIPPTLLQFNTRPTAANPRSIPIEMDLPHAARRNCE